MKILLIIILIIVAIVAILLIIALFVKRNYSIDREIIVNKPKRDVFNYIKYLKNQNHYSKWAMMDPNMIKTFTGTDGTVGFKSAWDSNNKNVGKGEQEIKMITEGDRISYLIHFIRPFAGIAESYMSTIATTMTQTKIKWEFQSKMNYPMNIMLLFMDMNKMVGNDLETGLNNLKKILEKQEAGRTSKTIKQ